MRSTPRTQPIVVSNLYPHLPFSINLLRMRELRMLWRMWQVSWTSRRRAGWSTITIVSTTSASPTPTSQRHSSRVGMATTSCSALCSKLSWCTKSDVIMFHYAWRHQATEAGGPVKCQPGKHTVRRVFEYRKSLNQLLGWGWLKLKKKLLNMLSPRLSMAALLALFTFHTIR